MAEDGSKTKDGGYLRAGFSKVNSIKAHISEIRQFLKDDPSYHLFGVSESELGPEVEDYLVRIDGYTLVRQDRKVRRRLSRFVCTQHSRSKDIRKIEYNRHYE